MAVVAYATKIATHSPQLYYKFAETSGSSFANSGSQSSAELTKSGAPTMGVASIQKDGADFALRVPTGGASKTGLVTTTSGWSMTFGLNIKTLPSSSATFLLIGTATNGTPFIRLRLYKTNIVAFDVLVGCASTSFGGQFYAEESNVGIDKINFLTLTCDYATKTLKAYVNGRLSQSWTTAEVVSPLTAANFVLQTENGLDYVIDELAIISDVVLTAAQIQLLFRAFRAIDETATKFYISTSGSYFGKGTTADPLDIWYGSRSGLYQPGDTVYLRGGTYNTTDTSKFTASGAVDNPVTIRNYPNELVTIDHRVYSPILELAGSNQKLVGQDYAQTNGLAGIKITNSLTSRLSFKGNYPELENITDGTISGTTFTTADTAVYLHDGSHAGLAFQVLDSSNNVLFSTTIAAVTSQSSCTLADPATYTLSATTKVRIIGTGGFRYQGGAIYDTGSNNQIIGVWAHSTGDGVTSFVAATKTKGAYNLLTDLGWMDVANRDHAHSNYWQNLNGNGDKEWIGNISIGNGGSNGKFDSVSGAEDNFIIRNNVTLGAGERQNGFLFDYLPTKTVTFTLTAGSTSGTFANVSGSLGVGDFVRIQGAGWYGQDFYSRVDGISGSSVTLAATAQTSVTNATGKVHGRSAFAMNTLIGSSNTGLPSQQIVVDKNVNLKPFDGRTSNAWTIGYAVNNLDVVVTDNVFLGGVTLNYWRNLTFTGNTVNTQGDPNSYDTPVVNAVKRTDEAIDWSKWSIDNNVYNAVNHRVLYSALTSAFKLSGVVNRSGTVFLPWLDNSNPSNDWNDVTGTGGKLVDANGTYADSDIATNQVILHPQNDAVGLTGAGNLTIINKQLSTTVSVNLSTLGLADGQKFQIRDVECFGETWGVVYDGTYNAASPSINVPVNVTSTVANFASLPGTGTFGTNYKTTDTGNWYRWGTDGAYHQITTLRTQPTGWVASGFRELPSYKPEFLVARVLPYEIPAVVGAPDVPSSLTATQVNNTRADLTWALTGPTATAVILEYARVDTMTWTTVTLGNVTSYSLTGLTSGKAYWFRISASNVAGASGKSSAIGKTMTDVRHFGTRPTVG